MSGVAQRESDAMLMDVGDGLWCPNVRHRQGYRTYDTVYSVKLYLISRTVTVSTVDGWH